MGTIYRGAQTVLVWLGPPENDVNDALEVAELHKQGLNIYSAAFSRYAYLFSSNVSRFFDAMKRLFENPYWSRLWVVQEFALAPSCWILYGAKWLEEQDLLDRLDGLNTISQD